VSLILNLWFVVWVLVAALYVGLLCLLDEKRAQILYAAGLLLAALIYVGFAGFNHGLANIGLEAAGLIVFGGLSVLTAHRWPLLLGLGWLAHGGWDFWHAAHHSSYVPAWSPPFCAGIDWAVGIAILVIVARRGSLSRVGAKYP